MKPNIGEQLRLRLPLITSPVIMTWIIVGPGRIFPLVKIWVGLRAYRTSHRGWIKSCFLSVWTAFPGIPLVAARALVKWIRVGLDWFLDFFFTPPPLGVRLTAKSSRQAELKSTKGYWGIYLAKYIIWIRVNTAEINRGWISTSRFFLAPHFHPPPAGKSILSLKFTTRSYVDVEWRHFLIHIFVLGYYTRKELNPVKVYYGQRLRNKLSRR